jgi:hypothetical protein
LLVFFFFTERQALAGGFSCPEENPKDAFGNADPHPKYPDPSDCAKFYICLNGVTPREQGCELGLVYNENTQSCDSPKNVAEWYDKTIYGFVFNKFFTFTSFQLAAKTTTPSSRRTATTLQRPSYCNRTNPIHDHRRRRCGTSVGRHGYHIN